MNLFDCLTLPIKSNKWGDSLNNSSLEWGELYFRDNGGSVLAIAHLDSVITLPPQKKKSIVQAPQLDDRLGVWVLLNLFPKFDIKVDVLLTDCEELGASTAEYFQPDKKYNWIVEFDRHGIDVVMYQYECQEYVELVEDFGFNVGWGSFSDICKLERLGVTCFNFGAGYYKEHTKNCYADLNKTKQQVAMFAQFWQSYKNTLLPIHEDSFVYNRYVECSGYGEHNGHNYIDWWNQEQEIQNSIDEQMSEEEYWKIKELAKFYGYYNVEAFINDGGLEFLEFDQPNTFDIRVKHAC